MTHRSTYSLGITTAYSFVWGTAVAGLNGRERNGGGGREEEEGKKGGEKENVSWADPRLCYPPCATEQRSGL